MRKLFVLMLALVLVLCTMQLPDDAEGAAILGTSVVGRVVNEVGVGFPGVSIRAVNVTTAQTYSTSTDAGGNYSLPLNPGLYDVTASYLNYSANISYSRTLVELGEEVRLNFTMSEVLCALTGYVTNGTSPIYGATVTMISDDHNYTAVSVNPLGQYTLSNVKPGKYTVTASKVGYYSSDPLPPIEMVRNVIKNLDFQLDEQPAELSGHVFYQGDGISGVRVHLSSAQFSTETITDERGNYSFDLVPAGSYTITFTKERYLTLTQSVGLSPFELKTWDAELEFDTENNTQKFILGFDLAHSLMIIGLIVSLIVLVVGLYVNYKIRRKPEMLEKDED
ncbi:MAG: carboxypeptidase-like regulatory domain-containing protein, partial [Methanomassiliicoccales archaeon]|nr:carboxypeptidase-like regulatory domain-containing protein [Methanomassiliicoccales archaeon]